MKKEIVSRLIQSKILITDRLIKEIEKNMDSIKALKNIEPLVEFCCRNENISAFFNKAKSVGVKVLFSYNKKAVKKTFHDFVSYFNARYVALERILRERPELSNLVAIGRLIRKREKAAVSIIGLVQNISITKNNNFFLSIEDQTGMIKVLVNKSKPELYKVASNLVMDQIIGLSGVYSDNIIFTDSILLPDVPISEPKQAKENVSVAFISDIHIGSKLFLREKYDKFLKWLNGELGDETQKGLAASIKYICIIGDIIDGVGIYPGQEDELEIKDIYKQYEAAAELLSHIPKDKQMIICPGNHDAMRISEPQPPLSPVYAQAIHGMNNVTLVSNPSLVNIHSSQDFEGYNILLYHGYSFDYYISTVDFLRNNGGYDRADLVMKFLLKSRHLAPTHSSTLYVPEKEYDPLVIAPKKSLLPDIFATGHVHKSSVSFYKNILLVCGSCWQSTTPFQEKVGHKPEPARVPIFNLRTRAVKVMRF